MRQKYEGAKFYSANDMSIGWALQRAETVIEAFNENKEITDINYILELYNIIKLFDTKVQLKSWESSRYNELTAIVKTFHPIIGRFCSQINDNNIYSYFFDVCVSYIEDFWEMIEYYNVYNQLTNSGFLTFISSPEICLWHILSRNKIVATFDREIAQHMISQNDGAELIISHYLAKHEHDDKQYYFPKTLSPQDKVDLVEKYVEAGEANPNYLSLLINAKTSKAFPITNKLKLSAKHKYQSFCEEHFSSNSGMEYGATISFADIADTIIVDDTNCCTPSFTYSKHWIKDNLDYPTLLNNLIYLFEFTDIFHRSRFPSRRIELGIMERTLGIKGKSEYVIGIAFQLNHMISSLQMTAYYKELLQYGIRLEDVFEWFFTDYLKEEFGAEGFYFNPPSPGSSFLEKCRTICSEMDSILKQFNMYVQDGKIDRELLEMASSTPSFKEVVSFNTQKYGYLENEKQLTATHLLFSDQSHLSFTERTQSKYETFADLICHEKMRVVDFHEYQKQQLRWLLDNNFIYEGSDKILKANMQKLILLKDMYCNEVICTTYSAKNPYLQELMSSGHITLEGTLFSRPEQNYLDFMLNDHQYDNGYKLRNRYIHGGNSSDEAAHESDYYQLVKIMSLFIIKINEDFCMKDMIQTNPC